MDTAAIAAFQQTVWNYYRAHGRHDLPWRQPGKHGFDPYRIMVSEIMLQQTQVSRVIPKFELFVALFPTVQDLASASLADVLRAWSGLGYNRRAKFLWQAAAQVMHEHNGVMPDTQVGLAGLAGVGANTAGAILAYAHNQPVVFIETNVRTVFIHHFFADQQAVPDKDIVPLIAATLPEGKTREWYWALMDYGTHLKQTVGNKSRASAHYVKQSKFAGSRRQIRGRVLKLLGDTPASLAELEQTIRDDRLAAVLLDLEREGFISKDGLHYRLAA